jgi:hypothetical protein
MSKDLFPKNLTKEQSDTVEKAALLILKAHAQAAAMLARVDLPESRFGRGHCRARVDGRPCGCDGYSGDGGTCLTRVTQDPGASEPFRSCGHSPSQHVPGTDDDDDHF